jgi:site-specific DNA-methyltransferase (adenine-specific)
MVLDSCMGSGTTAVACIQTNRKFIGFETDKNYFDKAEKRIKLYLSQTKLNGGNGLPPTDKSVGIRPTIL